MITIDENNVVYIPYDDERMNREFFYFLEAKGKSHGISKYNFIIKYYQQDVFYKAELELLQNSEIFEKIVLNRIKYLSKSVDELTSEDILQGFKRSGIHYGYGHFNPLWIKWFYQRYNIKTCYDPCGGWGHRILGSLDLDLYIYNDLSPTVYKNVNRIIHDFKLECITKTYNNDARTFIPIEDFEAMYTCPPYYNLEHYECGDFADMNDYNNFIDSLFNVFYSKESCKIFGLMIREDLLPDKYKNKCSESFCLDVNRSKHISKGGKHIKQEYVYIFKK